MTARRTAPTRTRTRTRTTDLTADSRTPGALMNTNTLAAAVIGFLFGGLTVSIAAELEEDEPTPPSHGSSVHQSVTKSRPW